LKKGGFDYKRRKKEEGSSATDCVADLTDVSQKEEGRKKERRRKKERKKKERRFWQVYDNLYTRNRVSFQIFSHPTEIL